MVLYLRTLTLEVILNEEDSFPQLRVPEFLFCKMMSTISRILILIGLIHSIAACRICTLQNAQPRVEDSGMDNLCPQYNSLAPKLLPDKRDCSLFYECSNGKAVVKRCPGNLHFNSGAMVCDYPENAGCQTGTFPKKGGKSGNNQDVTCPPENSRNGNAISHPTDCTKFFVCDRGTPYQQRCPMGLHFNPASGECDYPGNVECGGSGNTPKPRENRPDDNSDKSCPSGKLMPHPTDCRKYYMCDRGNALLRSCQYGLDFNPRTQACDYPENAGCRTRVSKAPRIKDDGNSVQCPSVNSKYPILLPDPEDCRKFYICDGGNPFQKACQANLYFNPKSKACDYPENVPCGKQVTKNPRDGGNDDNSDGICPSRNSKQPVLLPHPTDCEKFYICDNGKPYPKTCQNGLFFNQKVQACDYPANVDCGKSVPDPPPKGKDNKDYFGNCPPSKTVLMPHPEKCNMFIMCDGGKSYAKSCPGGLYYNPKLQACDYPENVACGKQNIQAAPGVSSPFCPSVNGPAPIFYTHPTNCSIYYMCSHGLAYEFKCPAKLHFNLRKKVCDYEWLANCRAGKAPNQTTPSK